MGCCASSAITDEDVVIDKDPPRFKISIMGPPRSGKTSLARRFVHNAYPQDYKADTQVDIGIKIVDVDGVGMATVEVWTHPGESDVQIITGDLAASDAWILVVSASTPFLAEALEREYKAKLKPQLDKLGPVPKCGLPLMVVVTNMDVVNSQPQLFVSVQQSVLGWADEHKALAAFVSCRTNDGILRAFKTLITRAQEVRESASASLVQPQALDGAGLESNRRLVG